MDRESVQVMLLLLFTYSHMSKIQCEVPANERHLAPKESTCEQPCPLNMDPVCGTDGETYDNPCFLEIAKCDSKGTVQQKCEGECPCPTEKPCEKPCPQGRHPVCSNSGVTYENMCKLEIMMCVTNNAIKKDCDGKCPCEICFHDKSEVMTAAGPKKLRVVNPGEEVLTVSDSGGLRYEPVIVDVHRDAHLHTRFYKIQTQTHEIMVTPKHFLYIGESVESSQLVMVDDVRVGDSLIVNTNSTLGSEKVTHIEFTYDRGISSPLVASGRILANNILASVYIGGFPPLKPKHFHSLCWFNRMLSSMKVDIFDVVEEKSGMPYWAAYASQVLKAVL